MSLRAALVAAALLLLAIAVVSPRGSSSKGPYHADVGALDDYQEDHLISLELGGHPTDPRNLWPEPYPRASEVDSIENELNARVCSGQLSLEQAQLKESQLKHRDG